LTDNDIEIIEKMRDYFETLYDQYINNYTVNGFDSKISKIIESCTKDDSVDYKKILKKTGEEMMKLDMIASMFKTNVDRTLSSAYKDCNVEIDNDNKNFMMRCLLKLKQIVFFFEGLHIQKNWSLEKDVETYMERNNIIVDLKDTDYRVNKIHDVVIGYIEDQIDFVIDIDKDLYDTTFKDNDENNDHVCGVGFILTLIQKGVISYPWKRLYHDKDSCLTMMKNIREYVTNLKFLDFDAKFSCDHKDFDHIFDNPRPSIVSKDTDYKTMDVLCDVFQEPNRLSARRLDDPTSPLEHFADERFLSVCLLDCFLNGGGITSESLREILYKNTKECTQFKPTLAISIFKTYKAKRVLDFSAGWGDRLIAAIAHDVEYYHGFDPNEKLRVGHQKIMDTFVDDKDRDKYRIFYKSFQSSKIRKETTYDMVFTSPPYFNLETYTNEHDEGQSIVMYPKFGEWLVNFLFDSLDKAWSRLEMDGHLIIHIADIYKRNICEPMFLYMIWKHKDCRLDNIILSIGDAKKPRPLWVFKKMNGTDIDRGSYGRELKRLYRDVYGMCV
jgi:hypothetical protein